MANERRRQSMRWWNETIKTAEAKEVLSTRYYPERGGHTLTGREIEGMWEKETKQ